MVALIGIGTAAYWLFFNKQTPSAINKTLAPGQIMADEKTRRVFIKDFHTYGNYFTPEKQQAIERTLYSYVSQRETVPDLYTGIIRQDSPEKVRNPSGRLVSRFILDISPVNVTYFLEISDVGNSNTIESIVLRCAPEDQQSNKSFTCLDGMKNRE